jgi:hypothetical protein
MADGPSAEDFWKKVYRKSPDVVARKIAGELLLVPVRGKIADMKKIFSLNPVGELIWQELDTHNNLRDIRDRVVSRFDVPAETAMADIEEFIDELLGAKLILEQGALADRPGQQE